MKIRELRGWLMRLFGLFHRKRREREFAEELESHLAMHIADNLRAGLSPEEARRRALIKLGGVMLTKELHRAQGGLPVLETLGQDLRFGWRMLRKNPGFSLIAILTLALGIGANTTIFSAIESLILHPFSLPNQDRLAVIYERNPGAGITRTGVAPGNLRDWREQSQTFERFVSLENEVFELRGADSTEGAERVFGYRVSAGFFAALGVKLMLGRDFQPDEDAKGREQVVILKHSLWERRFGSDPNVLGQSIRLNNKAYTVIGVAPKEFNFPYSNGEFWTPFVYSHPVFQVFGLLKPGVSLAQGDAEIRALSLRAQQQYPATISGVEAFAISLNEDYTRGARSYSSFTLGAVAFVLLIACANVANLLLARGSARQKELAARMALGATRWRLMRQLLTESLLLALLGGLVGLLFSVWGITALANSFPPDFTKYIPGWERMGVNVWALGFTMLASLLTGVLCGLLPAWQATRVDFNEILKEGGKGVASGARNRWRNILVVAEVALSLMLLAGAGLLIRSLINIFNVDLGFDPDNVMLTRVILPEDRYERPEQIVNFYQALERRVTALPGVAAAGAIDNGLPWSWTQSRFQIAGQTFVPGSAQAITGALVTTPGYFAVIGIPLRAGRLFTTRDDANAPRVALVNEAFALRFFAGGSAIRQRLSVDNGPPSELVGVVGNTVSGYQSGQVEPGVYLPFSQHPNRNMALIVRGLANQTGKDTVTQAAAAIRQELAALDPNLPFPEFVTLRRSHPGEDSTRRVITALLGIFASIALVMATVGLFAVMSFAVAQRTHEIGVRIALGAQTRDVLAIVVKQGLRLVSIGIIIGLIGAFAVTRALSQLLYGVTASDPITYAIVAGLLLATALVACVIPARRATKIDPMIALRCE